MPGIKPVHSPCCIGILNHLFFWPEPYRRTGGMSIVFLFDENPDVASVGSGGAAVGGARSVPDHAARSHSERAVPSARVGNRFSAPQIVWNKSNRCAGERGGAGVGRRCMNSSGDMTIWVVPSLNALFSCNTTWPARLRLSRSLAIAGRVI